MTRRLHACLTCQHTGGLTRHENRICAACRRGGVTHRAGRLLLSSGEVRLVPWVKDAAAPTLAELGQGVDLSTFLNWHGTDCACTACRADRIPGRAS